MPPEHSPAWLAGAAAAVALIVLGVTLEYSAGARNQHVGAFLAILGFIGLAVAVSGYRRNYKRMTESPLVVRQRPCCERPVGNGRHVCVEVFNPDPVYTIEDVELQVDVSGPQSSPLGHLLKWVGEAPSKRNVAAGEYPHAELGGFIDQKPYLVFWHVPGSLGSDPRSYGRTWVPPGDYKMTITIRSRRKPSTWLVKLACTTASITVECKRMEDTG